MSYLRRNSSESHKSPAQRIMRCITTLLQTTFQGVSESSHNFLKSRSLIQSIAIRSEERNHPKMYDGIICTYEYT